MRAVNGRPRKTLILIPRGAGKTTLMALVALHHLLTVTNAKIYCVAASVPQARILFEAATDFARRLDHENIVFRHLELRWCPDPDEPTMVSRHMRVLGAAPLPTVGLAGRRRSRLRQSYNGPTAWAKPADCALQGGEGPGQAEGGPLPRSAPHLRHDDGRSGGAAQDAPGVDVPPRFIHYADLRGLRAKRARGRVCGPCVLDGPTFRPF